MSRTSENKIRNLLQKWLSGDTNRQEEKQLETLAKEDAFLAEAMEGYRQFPEGQHEERLARLRSNVEERSKEKRSLIFYLSRAAAVIVFLVIAGVGVNQLFPTDSVEIGENEAFKTTELVPELKETQALQATEAAPAQKEESEEAEVSEEDIPEKNNPSKLLAPDNSANLLSIQSKQIESKTQTAASAPSKPPAITSPIAEADLPAQVLPSEAASEPAAAEETVVDVRGSRSNSTNYYVDDIEVQATPTEAISKDSGQTPAVIAADAPAAPLADAIITEELAQSKEVFEEADSAYKRDSQKAEKKKESARKKKAKMAGAQRQIQGLVQDAATQEPIPFANIMIAGTKDGTLTDIDGKFKLNVASSTQQLAVSYLGYEEQVVKLGNSDQVEVLLNESNQVLSEVVITGYDSKVKKVTAKPKKGFKKYQKYINANRVYPEAAKAAGIKGEVIIEFLVGDNGRPAQLKIRQSLGYGCDEEALRLIREGADWKGTGLYTEYTISFGQ